MRVLFLVLLLLAAVAPVAAQVSLTIVAAPLLMAGAMDAGAAAQRASAMTGGRVLDVQQDHSAGGAVYLVKVLLEDGRVKIIRIEGAAGTADN